MFINAFSGLAKVALTFVSISILFYSTYSTVNLSPNCCKFIGSGTVLSPLSYASLSSLWCQSQSSPSFPQIYFPYESTSDAHSKSLPGSPNSSLSFILFASFSKSSSSLIFYASSSVSSFIYSSSSLDESSDPDLLLDPSSSLSSYESYSSSDPSSAFFYHATSAGKNLLNSAITLSFGQRLTSSLYRAYAVT